MEHETASHLPAFRQVQPVRSYQATQLLRGGHVHGIEANEAVFGVQVGMWYVVLLLELW